MKYNPKDIPTYTTKTFRENYFRPSADLALQPEPGYSGPGHFEIHRRDDYRYQCREIIPANRLDFFMVNLITAGEGIKSFGVHEYYAKRGMLCFESPGKITSWQAKADNHAGYFCLFDADFFQHNLQAAELIASYPFFQVDGFGAIQLSEDELLYFNSFFEEIEKEYASDSLYKAEIMRSFLIIIMKKAQSLYPAGTQSASPDNSNAGLRLTKAFTKLFDKDFDSLKILKPIPVRNLDYYSAQLNVSKNHLIDTVKSVAGKPPGVLMHERMVREAAQLLIHTELSIAEISYLFNFESQSYFARFYKRYMDISPSSYREREKQVVL
jgi:AraC family transcriptional activator of pobA